MTADIPLLQELLTRYASVERQLAALNEEREAIRSEIKSIILSTGQDTWRVAHQQENYKVHVARRINVIYDEEKLKQRLAARYPLVLEPDLRKIRQNLDRLRSSFEPHLELIGSPSRERVRESIESGQLTAQNFQGAFEKRCTETLYISRQGT
jgi:hypothetical protein